MYLILALGTVSVSFGQDPQFTQFNSLPQYLNPAFAGNSDGIHRFAAGYRNQWPGVERGYSTYMASYDASLEKYKAGAGLYVLQDAGGTSYLTNTQVGLNAAYALELNRKYKLRAGLQACYNQKKLQPGKLIFNDQLITGQASLDATVAAASVQYFDVGAGALLDSKLFWVGVSARHLNKPEQSLTGHGASAELPIYIGVQSGFKYEIVKPEKFDEPSPHTIGGLLNYRHQGVNDQLDIGVSYFYKLINFTMWYRGIPFKTYGKGYTNSECVAFCLAYEPMDKPFRIGYSYDYTISKLSSKTTAGAHEITLGHIIGSKKGGPRKNRETIGGKQKF
jgi:type IX secretion system PorP/SprF family membrane protein